MFVPDFRWMIAAFRFRRRLSALAVVSQESLDKTGTDLKTLSLLIDH
ncbi:hypothetical protein [Leptolyngbya sp. AN02str]